MATAQQKLITEDFSFSSSIAADVCHAKSDSKAYEWWYFDALSDDGKDAVVIIFLDNFIFSPRYNSSAKKNNSADKRFPAVAFVYYHDGKPVYRAINEFSPEQFEASFDKPECKIGDCSFTFESASYGSGYLLSINAKLSSNRTLEAHFEWLLIESDFTPEKTSFSSDAHHWNLVSPRSDVTGKISVFDKKGENLDVVNFRGTGYHDHNFDNRWLPATVKDWHWGRAHFADSSAVFYRYIGNNSQTTKLFVIRDGKLRERDANYQEQNFTRDKFGIKYPRYLRFETEDNLKLRVKHLKIIDSSFFYLRFLSEMTLTLRDGKARKTVGLTEYLAPKTLKYGWLNWLIDMRIGKNGKGSFLP